MSNAFVKGRDVQSPNDVVLTPLFVSKYIIEGLPLQPNQKILDPCSGDGAFYDHFPYFVEKEWCEISKGKDFFKNKHHFDWIISNPPYSLYDEFMSNAMKYADNIVFLVPLTKPVASMGRLRSVEQYGGIVSITWTSAKICDFPMGYPIASIHYKKGYKGDTIISKMKL